MEMNCMQMCVTECGSLVVCLGKMYIEDGAKMLFRSTSMRPCDAMVQLQQKGLTRLRFLGIKGWMAQSTRQV